MKSCVFKSLLALWSLSVLSGCIESATVVQVKKDGSGVITVREFMSPEATSMMSGFDGMAAMIETDSEAVPGLSDLPAFLQGMVMERAGEYGPDVRLTAVRDVTNDNGWKGYMARFEFDDANQVRLTSASPGDDEEGGESEYALVFTPGDIAELRLVPSPPAAAPAMEDSAEEFDFDSFDMEPADEADMDMDMDMAADFDPEFGEMMGGMEDAMGGMFEGMATGMEDAMSGMFGNMFKGMRMSIYIDVEGDIVDTDAAHRSETRPNRIALLDVNMDELMAHPDAMSRMMSNDPNAVYELQNEGAAGITMENPEKTITIRFR